MIGSRRTGGFVSTRASVAGAIFALAFQAHATDADRQSLRRDSIALTVSGNLDLLRSDLSLPAKGAEGSSIQWKSDAPAILSNAGAIVGRPAKGAGDAKVVLSAMLAKGTETTTRSFPVTVAQDEGFVAYLFAYFTGNSGNQEAIRFALSDNGFTYKAINKNNPVLNSATISSTGGIRDPHILRGASDDYFMVATDMVSAQGWSSNRAMVLMKSANLTDWNSSVVNIPKTYPAFANADRVWAPQTIYDPSVEKYMVYFAMRLGSSDYDKIYYAYANSAFTGLESAPRILFDNGKASIDADIVSKDGSYHLFFKTEGNGNGIKSAISSKLSQGYALFDEYLQSTTNAVEGSSVFRLINSDTWILMYDMYTSGAYQFTTTTDLKNYVVATTPVSFDFTPRHGTIIPVTLAEKQALNAKWNPSSVARHPTSPQGLGVFCANGWLRLEPGQTPGAATISVVDAGGRERLRGEVSSARPRLDVSGLPRGVYRVLATVGNRVLGVARVPILGRSYGN